MLSQASNPHFAANRRSLPFGRLRVGMTKLKMTRLKREKLEKNFSALSASRGELL
jgi:hypothetical protein